MSSPQETLFSLELVIDYVRFDGSRGNLLNPAVGVRFLDFPTLLIYQSGQEDHPSKSGYADLCVSPEALSQPDDGDKLKYPFHKGKSCLFKINLHSLHTHLMNTPLYTMVLDVKDEIPKLIGSSLISMAKVTERVKQDVEKHGIGTPSAYGERRISPVCNLMGDSIGVISLAYKIVSLGAHLIPHIPENRVYEVGVTRREEEQPKMDAKCEGVNGEKDETERHNVLSQHVSLDDQTTDVVISEAEQPGAEASTPTEQTKHRVSWCEDAQEFNTFCPPPLFYNSGGNNQDRENLTGMYSEMENLKKEDPEEGNDEVESSDMHESPEVDRSRKFTSTPSTRRPETNSSPLADVIRQLPLLSALLAELSQLNLQNPPQQPMAVLPELTSLYTSQSGAKPKTEEPKTSPKPRPGQCKIRGGIVSKEAVKSGKKNEEKLQSKRTLKYGLTNTFRLRLKMVKPGQTKRHECIEYQELKQYQPKRQMITDHKNVRQSVSRGVRLDDTVQTLVSSIEMDPKPAESRSQSANQRPEKHVAAFTNEDVPLAEKDNIRVHIPSPYSDRSEQRSASSERKSIKDQSVSRPGLSEEYQDDFTSLNTSDGFSPEPFSSPEPNRRKKHSGSSSSSRSKGLPVPARAETSPQRSLKSTQIIRPRLQTSALSVSSDETEDRSLESRSYRRHMEKHTPSVRRTFGKSQSFDSDSAEKAMAFSRMSEDSDVTAHKQPLKSVSSAEHTNTEEELDKLGSLGLERNYHHISELVINKLPGYTL